MKSAHRNIAHRLAILAAQAPPTNGRGSATGFGPPPARARPSRAVPMERSRSGNRNSRYALFRGKRISYSIKSGSERPKGNSSEPPRGVTKVQCEKEQGFSGSLLGNQDPAQSSASTEIKESK